MTDNEKVAEVRAQLALSDDERLVSLGRALQPTGLGADEERSDIDAAEAGANLIDRLSEHLRAQICGSIAIRMACEKASNSDGALILPLVDIVATVLSGPPVFTATASLLSRGIARYCAQDWRASQ
jgi:hypothetical protein